MNRHSLTSSNGRICLKNPSGWFAAGESFRQAMALLSDGAFRLFVHLCLQADRRTGRFTASHKELATALGKSKRVIGCYVRELQAEGLCTVGSAKNQHAATSFEIRDGFWPYDRANGSDDPPELREYVENLKKAFLELGCTSRTFTPADAATARDLYRRGIPLPQVRDAMLIAASRKYSAWLTGKVSGPIRSLAYFSPTIAEIQEQPLPDGYSEYLRRKVKRFVTAWTQRGAADSATKHQAHGPETAATT